MKKISLGDAATFVNGYPFRPSQWTEDGLEIIRIQNLTGSRGNATNRFNGEIKEKYRVKKGDLLISWSATLGVFEWDRKDGWLNQHIFKVVFDKEEWNKTYFKYLIEAKLQLLSSQVHGATMKHITKKRFDAVQIPLPPLPEQRAIAARLDAADRLRSLDAALVAKYDELKRSLFLEMFGDPVFNEMEWEVKPLYDGLTFLTSGSRGWAKYYSEVGVPFIRIQNVGDGELHTDSIQLVTPPCDKEADRTRVKSGDVLLSITADLGRAAVVSKVLSGGHINQHLALMRTKDSLNPQYLAWSISSERGKTKFLRMNSGGTKQGLNFASIRAYPIQYPPVNLQESFAGKLHMLNRQQSLARAAAQRSEELFLGVLGEVFG